MTETSKKDHQGWAIAASLSSVASAFVASICCVGPLVFALLGVGGAGLLLKFEPYRPYFAAGTFVLLGTGFYFTYRAPKALAAKSGADCACPAPRANRVGKASLWLATCLVVLFLGFPYAAAYLFK